MRIALDTTYALRAPHSGTAVYIERLVQALGALGSVEVLELANPRRRPPAGGGVGSLRNALSDQWWTEVELPRRARAAGAQLIHHPLPAWSAGAGLPQVITVHDLAFAERPDLFDPAWRAFAQAAHRLAARRAGAVICVSETTAAAVRARWRAPRIWVAAHGPGQELSVPPRRGPDHFLYVGDDERRKNVDLLLAAYADYRQSARAPLGLVLAGAVARGGPGVRCIPAPSPAQLAELHAGAAALVHPAVVEGFGLTLLEAMSVGTPVIALAIGATAEVCGAAAELVPADRAGLAAAMAALAADPAQRERRAVQGRRRAAEFSWRRSAQRHLEAYSSALR